MSVAGWELRASASWLVLIALGLAAGTPIPGQYRIQTVAGGGLPDSAKALSLPVHEGVVAVGPSGDVYLVYFGAVYRISDVVTMVRVAGNYGFAFGGDGGPATSAGLDPAGLAVDATGNLLIADARNNRIRRVDAQTGIITTIAGNGAAGRGGDGGPATSAGLNRPRWLALDASGNLFISDTENSCVRRVDARTGVIATVASAYGFGGRYFIDPLTVGPAGLAVDSTGNLFIADSRYNRVLKLDATTGALSQYVGDRRAGFAGDGGPAANASLFQPAGLTLDRAGNLYIGDTQNQRVRRVDASTGVITTVAGNGSPGFNGDGGPATTASFYFPTGLALDNGGNLLVGDSLNSRLRRVEASTATVTTVAGNGAWSFGGDGGPAVEATLWFPSGLAVDRNGSLFIGDNYRIRRIDAQTGSISTIAGDGMQRFGGDGGPAIAASLSPGALAMDNAGNLLIADVGNNRVRRIDLSSGIISTVAGNGARGFDGDGGPAEAATLNAPIGLAVDSSGNLFIADRERRVRRVDAITGIITTFAGTGMLLSAKPRAGDLATATSFGAVRGLAVDPSGDVFISDEGWCSVVKVDAQSGIITTVIGENPRGFDGDGGPATGARLNEPTTLALDSEGNLLIADMDNNRVRRVDLRTNTITTIAGNGEATFRGDGGPGTEASFHYPDALAVDQFGNIYVSDTWNFRIRKLVPDAPTLRP